MKRFLIKFFCFLLLLIGVDALIGCVGRYLEKNARGGYTYRDTFICDKLETSILLTGSSRCVRHYNPQIITDSLGLSCYNSGQMGNGIILNYGRLRMINERKKPDIIIYDLHPNFDLFVGEDNHRYLTWLKGHYDRDGIEDIFHSIDETEKFKMMSKMYRYNSRIIELLVDFIHPIDETRADGFSPLKGEMDLTKIRSESNSEIAFQYDSLKLSYIEQFVNESKGSKLCFVVSPIWYGMNEESFLPVKKMCEELGIPFIDFSNNPKYLHNNEFFKDGSHMNEKGADSFTRDLINHLRAII